MAMFSIEIIPDKGGCDVILLKDGHELPDMTMWLKSPVEVAFRVRELVETILLKKE